MINQRSRSCEDNLQCPPQTLLVRCVKRHLWWVLPVRSALKIAMSPEVSCRVRITSALNLAYISPSPHPFAIRVAMQFMAFTICAALSSVQSVHLWCRTRRTAVPPRTHETDWHLGVRLDDCPRRMGGDRRCLRWCDFPGNSG